MDSKKDRAELLAKLMAKVTLDPQTGCWTWGGARDKHGYGNVSHHSKKYYAHRAMFTCYTGQQIPEGMCILHTCDAGHLGCVNPKHLKLGTYADNNRDAAAKGRAVTPKFVGEDHACSKLSNKERNEIRELWENRESFVPNITITLLSKRFNVTERTVYRVVRAKTADKNEVEEAS